MELHRLADLSSIAPLESQLRTPSLRPDTLLGEVRTSAERQELVRSVIERRSKLVCGEDDSDGGKLLIYAPRREPCRWGREVPVQGFL